MRIGIDARLWNETGVGRYIRNLVRQLYVLDTNNTYVLFVQAKDAVVLKKELADARWKIVKTNIHWHSIAEQTLFPGLLLKEQLDLMHFPYFSLPIVYPRPFVITIHDLIIYHFPTGKASTLPLPLYKIKHAGYKAVIAHAMRHAKKIIVPLQSTKDDLLQTKIGVEKRIVVTYEGVDTMLTKKADTKHAAFSPGNYFLYVGNAYPHKNIETLIRAFMLYKENTKNDTVLVLVGKEDYFYKKIKQGIGNYPAIRIFHSVPDSMLHDLYAHAIAVVAPSYMEGFGLVPLEAMANDCLVIASNIPAHKEVCEDAALYVDPKYPKDIEFALHHAANLTEEKRKKLIQAGHKRMSFFSWEKMAKDTLQIYESCNRIR